MKTTINIPKNELLNTEFSVFNINIRLDDDCKNGHSDFAITGEYWYKGERYDRKNPNGCGCIHDEILKLKPDLKIW